MQYPGFLVRSWYFLGVAVIGTLHITIPLGLAGWSVARDGEVVTQVAFLPVAAIGLVWLNLSAMRAVIRSWGLTGEPDFVRLVQSMGRHVTIDLGLPVLATLLLALGIAGVIEGLHPGWTLIGAWPGSTLLPGLAGVLELWLPLPDPMLGNAAALVPGIGMLVFAASAVPIAAGAVGVSAKTSAHLPGYGFGRRSVAVLATLAINLTILWGLAAPSGIVGAMLAAEHLASPVALPGLLLCLLSYLAVLSVMALAYCEHESLVRADHEVLRDLMRYGVRREQGAELRALRLARSGRV